MTGVCCCRGTLQEKPRRDVGATADKLKRGLQKRGLQQEVLQKVGLQKGALQKLQENGEQEATMQVCSPPRLHTRLCTPAWADKQ